ncbi:MAG: hypothetical protein B6244_13820 [Candidatus Cloacimonetes bacterium 4572_55]|nr:MAG: hypothetical protein B6244_13820 [Candidatus Cloacimonetes bacterium 4572_55]
MKNLIPHFIQQKYQSSIKSGAFQAVSMFVDISGFTQTTEALIRSGQEEGAEILSDIMRFYFTPAVQSVYEHKGFIVGFAGDAFTALFPYGPDPKGFQKTLGSFHYCKPTAEHLLAAAYEINRFFAHNPIYHSKYGDFTFGVKVGLAMGHVEWGIVGGSERKTFYFRGTAIDGCAHSEHQASKGEIWAPADYAKLVHDLISDKTIKGEFCRIDAAKPDKFPKPVGFEKWEIEPEAIRIFYGEEVVHFQRAEFRKIAPVFISFENVTDLDEFITVILQELQTYGGTISRLDFGDKGGNVLAFFGAPVAYENLIERSLQFIIAIRQNLTELANMSDVKLRAGVAAGVSYCGLNGSDLRSEFTCLGNAVNQSARFMMKAKWGQILVDSEIAQNKLFHFSHLGDFVFKGRGNPIPTYELLGKKLAIETFYTGEMVGRKTELTRLKNFCQPIFDNTFAGVAYVYGEAGMGKSRLMYELRKSTANVSWFYCPCEEILRQSMNPFIYFLRGYFNQLTTATDAENKARFERKYDQLISAFQYLDEIDELRRTKSILGAMINLHWEGSLYEQLDAKGRYENSLFAFKNLIKAESLIKPVILEIEDGHWIDSDSQKMLKALTRNIADYPIGIISACRYRDDGKKFRFDVEKETSTNEIDLNYLNREGLKTFSEQTLDRGVADELVDLLMDRTDGNPFFAEQMMLYLRENDLLELSRQKKSSPFVYSPKETGLVIPSNVNSVLISRLDRLSVEVKQVIQTASVLGRKFELKILSLMLKDDPQLTGKVKTAKEAVIWSALSEIHYIFKHALMRDSAYDMQLRARLRQLHRIAGQAYEDLYAADISDYYPDLAFHYDKAEIVEKAVYYLEEAGNYAKENFQNQQALDFYDKFLESQGEDKGDKKAEVLLKKGDILELIGKLQEAERIFLLAEKYARQSDKLALLAKAQNRLATLNQKKGDHSEASSLLKSAYSLSKKLNNKQLMADILGNMGTVHRFKGQYDKAIGYFKKKLKLSKELHNERAIGNAISNIGLIHCEKGDYDEAMEGFENSLAIYKEVGEKELISQAYANIGMVYASRGDRANSLFYWEKQLEISEELGDKFNIAAVVGNLGMIYWSGGEYDKAMIYYEKALAIFKELGIKRGIAFISDKIGNINIDLGEYDKAMQRFERSFKLYTEMENKACISEVYASFGDVYAGKKKFEKAISYYEKAILMARELEAKHLLMLFLFNKAKALYSLEKFSQAKKLGEEGLQIAEKMELDSYIFRGRIFFAKVKFALGDQHMLDYLNNLLKIAENKEDICDLNYELWKIIGTEDHRRAALELYQKFYEKTPRFEYKQRIGELQE